MRSWFGSPGPWICATSWGSRATWCRRAPPRRSSSRHAGCFGSRAKAVPARRVPAGPATPFAAIRGGLHRLPAALAEALGPGTLRLGSTVVKLGREERGPYRVATDDGDDLPADAVVLATPASVSAELLAEVAPRAAELIRQISAASTAIALF